MRLFLRCILLFSLQWSTAQQVGSSLSRKKILIGEPLELTLSCKMPSSSVFRFQPETGVLPAFKKQNGTALTQEPTDQLEQIMHFHDTIISMGQQKMWKGTYTVSGWDEGTFSVRGQKILVDDSTFTFPEVEFSIELVKEVKGKDIYDIEEHFSELPEKENPWLKLLGKYWWMILLLLLIVAFLLYRRRVIRNASLNPGVAELSLKDRTLLAIDLLEKEKLWEKGKLKEHYVELSFILRSYLSSRYELNLLENTTHEAQLMLSHKGLHPETIRVIGTVLNQSDMVKFARSAPLEMEVLKISQLVRQIVAETSLIEFEHE